MTEEVGFAWGSPPEPEPTSREQSFDREAFRERLRTKLKERGVLARPLAEGAGLNESAVRDILHRDTIPRIDTLICLAAALGCHAIDLVPELDWH